MFVIVIVTQWATQEQQKSDLEKQSPKIIMIRHSIDADYIKFSVDFLVFWDFSIIWYNNYSGDDYFIKMISKSQIDQERGCCISI